MLIKHYLKGGKLFQYFGYFILSADSTTTTRPNKFFTQNMIGISNPHRFSIQKEHEQTKLF